MGNNKWKDYVVRAVNIIPITGVDPDSQSGYVTCVGSQTIKEQKLMYSPVLWTLELSLLSLVTAFLTKATNALTKTQGQAR